MTLLLCASPELDCVFGVGVLVRGLLVDGACERVCLLGLTLERLGGDASRDLVVPPEGEKAGEHALLGLLGHVFCDAPVGGVEYGIHQLEVPGGEMLSCCAIGEEHPLYASPHSTMDCEDDWIGHCFSGLRGKVEGRPCGRPS